jgi:WD repeat-containing protein 35
VVCVVGWNENYRKLTTSDSNGLIIVWMLHKGAALYICSLSHRFPFILDSPIGMWFEEMINNRNKSVVKGSSSSCSCSCSCSFASWLPSFLSYCGNADMKWTSDGQKICIIYEDGAVIVGSVDGNRLWCCDFLFSLSPSLLSLLIVLASSFLLLFLAPRGAELNENLAFVEWSPAGRNILFGTDKGEVMIYDQNGTYSQRLNILTHQAGQAKLVGIQWSALAPFFFVVVLPSGFLLIAGVCFIPDRYNGVNGYMEVGVPSLAIAFDNGYVQLMRDEMVRAPERFSLWLTFRLLFRSTGRPATDD